MVNEVRSSGDLWTPANVVTLIRICGVPLFIIALLSPWPTWLFPDWPDIASWKEWIAAGIFIILAATDGLDGYLARSRNEVTDFGKFMDPLADKILVAAALLALIELDVLPSWVALIILCREFIVSGVRMVAATKGVVIAASWYGKAKTVVQVIALLLFIIKDNHMVADFSEVLSDRLYLVSWVVMIVALALTIVSMLDYFAKAKDVLGFNSGVQRGNESCEFGTSEELLVRSVLASARERGASIGTAESCTGGLIAATLTSIPGSSAVVAGAVISYSDEVKRRQLGVSKHTLEAYGAVSQQTALEMAQGARGALEVDIAVSVTGIAGPDGGSIEKPVGTVWIGLSCDKRTLAHRHHFEGDREAVRKQAVAEALAMIEKYAF